MCASGTSVRSELRELQLERVGGRLDVIDERPPLGAAGTRRERRDVES